MDLFQVKCFLSIVDHRSFTEASHEVCISQSSLSKNISKLEDELGVKLFDRSKRTAELTPAGRTFEGHARTLMADYGALETDMKRYSEGGTLHIGSVDHMGRVGLAVPIASFLNQSSPGGVEIDIEEGDTRTLMNLLLAGKIDLAFIAHIQSPLQRASNIDDFDLSGYRLHTLVRDQYHVVVSKHHPLARRECLTWSEIAGEKLVLLDKTFSINAIIRDMFRQQGLTPNICFECEQVDTILGLVEENYGVSLMSKKVADSNYQVTAIPLDLPITRNTVLVEPRQFKENLAGRFVRHTLEYFEAR